MGFSTSAVVAIFTVSLIYMASMFYPLAEMSYNNVQEANKYSNELWNEKLNTKIVITSWTDNGTLKVYNNGSVTLNSSKVNIILNGSWNPPVSINPGGVWPPSTPIDVDIGSPGGRVKIIAANGAADYMNKSVI